MLDEAIRIMADRIKTELESIPTVFLYGSAVLNDFRFGWSDIDILVLTDAPINKDQASRLVNLRQTLTNAMDGNQYFRLFEGGILSKSAFFRNEKDTVIYWGTSGQRVTETFSIDSFAIAELLTKGALLCGEDLRVRFTYPTHELFKADITRHYNIIRKHVKIAEASITSCGWLLDIARGLHTIRTDKVIAKTSAGEWAIAEALAPNMDVLKRAVQIRKNPREFINDTETLKWCAGLGPHIQEFADVLEKELSYRHTE